MSQEVLDFIKHQQVTIRQRFTEIARHADISKENFSILLAYAVNRKLIDVKTVALRCGVNRTTVSKWRAGHNRPTSSLQRQSIMDQVIEHIYAEIEKFSKET